MKSTLRFSADAHCQIQVWFLMTEQEKQRVDAMYSTGLAELVLIVKDVRTAVRFYRDGLTPETEADGAWAWFWAWFWAGPPGHPQRVALPKGTLLLEQQPPPGRCW